MPRQSDTDKLQRMFGRTVDPVMDLLSESETAGIARIEGLYEGLVSLQDGAYELGVKSGMEKGIAECIQRVKEGRA